MNEAVPAAPSSAESMAKQGCEKLGLDAFDALVRRARTCRRFDESMRVPREFLLELAELAHLVPCGANAQRLRFHVVSGAEDCARVFDELAWAGALKDWPGPVEGERPTGYIAILAERTVPGKPAAPITEVDTGIAAQTMMLAARSATPEVAACMFKAFTPRAIDVMGLDNDKYELKLIMAFGVPAETQVIDAIDSNPDGTINYWRDEAQVHHVPKRPLADVLV
ncbi:MAG: nitroreductase family protein [Collinsella sp.]|nr:nitroreductase family protein [Collinsella sp.]